jgi:hypothetical protein
MNYSIQIILTIIGVTGCSLFLIAGIKSSPNNSSKFVVWCGWVYSIVVSALGIWADMDSSMVLLLLILGGILLFLEYDFRKRYK